MTIKTEEPKITDETTNSAIRRDTLVPLPYFDGQLKDLPLFKKILDGTTKDAKFSNFENLRRIQQYVKGEAERSIRYRSCIQGFAKGHFECSS